MSNGTLETLAELIRGANLNAQQLKSLQKLTRQQKPRAPHLPRSGPWHHCRKGDRVNVAFADGAVVQMTVWKVGQLAMRLSTLPFDKVQRRAELMSGRIKKMMASPRGHPGQRPAKSSVEIIG